MSEPLTKEERIEQMRDAIERRIPPNQAVLDALISDLAAIEALEEALAAAEHHGTSGLAVELVDAEKRVRTLESQVSEYEAELQELRHLFELQERRMGEAVALWRSKNPGNELVHPDLGKLLGWLLEQARPIAIQGDNSRDDAMTEKEDLEAEVRRLKERQRDLEEENVAWREVHTELDLEALESENQSLKEENERMRLRLTMDDEIAIAPETPVKYSTVEALRSRLELADSIVEKMESACEGLRANSLDGWEVSLVEREVARWKEANDA